MIQYNENKTSVKIEAFSFFEFLTELQEEVKKGYELSPLNEHYPEAYQGYSVTLVKSFSAMTVTPVAEDATKPAVGRPRKVA